MSIASSRVIFFKLKGAYSHGCSLVFFVLFETLSAPVSLSIWINCVFRIGVNKHYFNNTATRNTDDVAILFWFNPTSLRYRYVEFVFFNKPSIGNAINNTMFYVLWISPSSVIGY